MEPIVADHPAVAEYAVIGGRNARGVGCPARWWSSGPEPTADRMRADLMAAVRHRIGPVAALPAVDIDSALPKNRAGKVLRKAMRAIVDGPAEPVPAAIGAACCRSGPRRPRACGRGPSGR
ncbi:hypothetical protein OHB26_27520 [Nocardia sp. NBC_01503]|uniref:AMP-binding enzyme n=1 Tax=Nocardia sp. NBC_01503 TaxID=2975997 RepID=UPI002E7BF0EA|nr:hypothetical protein [Nocardia sp. NBC_01503]WTL30659.1 hypothetical protein OHB26_27520 [Nocardia sp. NBC_01503]